MRGDFGHNMVAWRATGRGLGDVVISSDQATLLGFGFNSAQIQQIQSAYASGALSAAGYNQIVSGNVDPDNLADYLDADPGAPQTKSSGSTVQISIPGSPTAAPNLAPGPAPRVVAPGATSFFSQATLISGIPNWMVVAGGLMLPLLLMGTSGGRRR